MDKTAVSAADSLANFNIAPFIRHFDNYVDNLTYYNAILSTFRAFSRLVCGLPLHQASCDCRMSQKRKFAGREKDMNLKYRRL